MINLKKSSIIICSIVRNAEKGLKKNIPIIKALCQQFKDYRIIVYENNSIDKTKELLISWHRSCPEKIHINIDDIDDSETIPSVRSVKSNPFFSRKRIAKMAVLRNKYMEYIDSNNWTADYLMVVDLDVARLDLKGILSSFTTKYKWDAVTAFGYSTSPKFIRRYHDTYALTLWEDNTPQTEHKISKLSYKLGKLKTTDNWIRVYSAFGGLAIYNYNAIKGLRYQVINNNDKRVEVKCEHYSIYKQMTARGFSNFYINPSMRIKYQDLTLTIIWKSIIFFIQKNIISHIRKEEKGI